MLKSVIRQYWFTGAATVVVVASAAYYVAFGDGEPEASPNEKKQRSKSKNKISGLVNEGNTCYINATLQALASCSIFVYWLNSLLERQTDETNLRTTSSLQMTMAGELIYLTLLLCVY